MKTTHHSEYLKLKSVYIKPVKNAFVSDNHLNEQWQSLNYLSQPDYNVSHMEYDRFEKFLIKAGIDLKYFSVDNTMTIDSLYCRDASIATDFGMIICNMGKLGRISEPKSHKNEYLKQEIPIFGEIQWPGTLEGGDVAWLDHKTLAVGLSYRSNSEGIRQLKNLLEPKSIEVLVVDLPHYRGKSDVFHLMSILSPVDKDLAVVYSPLMPIGFRNELINRGFNFVEVPEEEFDSMGCNVLAVAPKKCIMVAGNPVTQKRLENVGCKVQVYEGNEISVKGGGGPTCLTRPLLRVY